MAYVLIDENKLSDALFHLIVVLYYDTSGRENGHRVILDEVEVFGAIVQLVQQYAEFFEKTMVDDCCQRFKISGHYLTNKNFALLVDMIVNGASAKEANQFVQENATLAAQKRSRKNDDDYEAWLTFIESGGTTGQWNKRKGI